MTSQTITRRAVLTALDVNTPIGKGPQTESRGKTGSPGKPQKLVEVSLQTDFERREMSKEARQEARGVGTKRDLDVDQDLRRPSPKRFKVDGAVRASLQAGGSRHGLAQKLERGNVHVQALPSQIAESPRDSDVDAASLPSSPISSPHSSSGFSPSVLNDTQNTLLTEPDDSRAASLMNRDEVRRRAQAIKLRLRLASYKVRTNQIDLPISRLQIRTTSPHLSRFPRLSAAHPSHHQPPLPSAAASTIPNIRLQQAPVEKEDHPTRNIPFSPPPSPRAAASPPKKTSALASPRKEAEAMAREALATPLLPRGRPGLLNRPSGSPSRAATSPGVDLTSSVVKGRAADGLLSLMHQRD